MSLLPACARSPACDRSIETSRELNRRDLPEMLLRGGDSGRFSPLFAAEFIGLSPRTRLNNRNPICGRQLRLSWRPTVDAVSCFHGSTWSLLAFTWGRPAPREKTRDSHAALMKVKRIDKLLLLLRNMDNHERLSMPPEGR